MFVLGKSEASFPSDDVTAVSILCISLAGTTETKICKQWLSQLNIYHFIAFYP